MTVMTGTAALLVTSAVSGSTVPTGETVMVTVRLFQFQPDTIQVPVGTRVIWQNQDEIQHSVVGGTPERPEKWASHALAGRGSTAEVTLSRAGILAYHCGRHPSMNGTIRVIQPGEEP